jgi:carboxymethylenebutenolidase
MTLSHSTGVPPLSRRGFLQTAALATGFALAAYPLAASQISTDSEGLVAGAVMIPVGEEEIPAYRAMPTGAGPFPLVLVVQEIFGVHEHIQDVCRRFAKLGYMAVATELFFRQGDVSNLTDIQQIIGEVVSKVPDQQVMKDLDATVAWARAEGAADPERLGITGFCWGGRITWLYAAHNPAVQAGVAWYGRLVGDSTERTPAHPVDLAAELKAPVLGLYGGEDQGIPLSTVEAMQDAITAADGDSEIVVYPDAPHAFFADYRPSYRQEAAEDGWQRLQAWFATHGVA